MKYQQYGILTDKGERLQKEKYAEQSETFRHKIGLERPAMLDGKELLMCMPDDSNRDSFVQWLEFKNYDE